MKRFVMTLFAALAALFVSVSGFGNGPLVNELNCYNSKIDPAEFWSLDDPTKASMYFYSEDAEACYSVKVVCSGHDIGGTVSVDPDSPEFFFVFYGATKVDSDGVPIAESSCGSETLLGLATSGWSVQCKFDTGAFNLSISPAKDKFCEDLD